MMIMTIPRRRSMDSMRGGREVKGREAAGRVAGVAVGRATAVEANIRG
jgi:hypothetical protein